MTKMIDYSNLEDAQCTLKDSVKALDDYSSCAFFDMLEDSCVKRFEYTLELSWKTMKKILKKVYGKSDDELTVNNIFRLMQGYGFILDWQNWKMYYEKRNNTVHEYNLAKSRDLIKIIPQFLQDTDFFINKLKEKLV